MQAGKGEIVIYQEKEGQLAIEVKLEDETLWLSQRQMGDLFEKDANTIGAHIRTIYAEDELDESVTATTFTVPQQEGKRTINRNIKFYNLDVILSVGYRVSSKRGTAFRKWANAVLKGYLIKGYSHNEKLLSLRLVPGKKWSSISCRRIPQTRGQRAGGVDTYDRRE